MSKTRSSQVTPAWQLCLQVYGILSHEWLADISPEDEGTLQPFHDPWSLASHIQNENWEGTWCVFILKICYICVTLNPSQYMTEQISK